MNFVLNFNICRVCMRSGEGQCMLKDVELKEKFTFTTQLKIEANDSLPTLVCEKCVQRLRISYDFVKLAQDSNANLKTFVIKVNKDFQQVTQSKQCVDRDIRDKIQLSFEEEEHSKDHKRTTNYTTDLLLLRGDEKLSHSISEAKNDANLYTKKGQKLQNKNSSELLNKDGYETVNEQQENEIVFEESQLFFVREDGSIVPETNDKEFLVLKTNDFTQKTSTNSTMKSEMQDNDALTNEMYLQEYEMLLEDDISMCSDFIQESIEDNGQEFLDEVSSYEQVEDIVPVTKPKDFKNANCNELAVQIEEQETKTTEFNENVETKKKEFGRKRAGNSKSCPGTEARYFCVKCNRDFSTRQNLNRHMATHEGRKPYVCQECGKAFSQNGSLKQHLYTHTGERPYVCDICKRGFTQWKCLAFHMRRHTGEKPFPCEHCGIAFRQKDGLKMHLMKQHLTTDKLEGKDTNVCMTCKKVLPTKKLLEEHLKRHLNKHKDVLSADCTSTAENLSTLDVPKKTNANSNGSSLVPVEIFNEEIEKEETELGGLSDAFVSSTHVLDVVGTTASDPGRAKKFQCCKCFKTFAIIKNLLRHLTIHKADLYQCKQCNLAFESKYALKHHRMREHKVMGNNLNECEECQLIFNCESELHRHLRSTHDLSCPQCPKLIFKTRNALLEHQIDH